eukprot:g12928.t1
MSEEEPSSPQGDRAQRCPVHLAFPDLVRCDKCQEVHKDLPAEGKAPLPGLKNSFPVVAAQSDTRLDHLDPKLQKDSSDLTLARLACCSAKESQHPDGVLDFYQRLEEKHGKYLFERNEQQEALELERRKLQLQRERTKKAKHDAERAVLDAEWRVADAERSVEERRARREQDLQALEVQVRQADILYDESAREMKKRLAEAEGLKIAEEAHLAASLRLWNAARAKTDAARRRYEEAKAAAAQRLCAREKEIQEMAEEMDRQEAEAKEQAEEHLRFAMRVQSSKIKEAVAANLPMAIKRTVAAQDTAILPVFGVSGADTAPAARRTRAPVSRAWSCWDSHYRDGRRLQRHGTSKNFAKELWRTCTKQQKDGTLKLIADLCVTRSVWSRPPGFWVTTSNLGGIIRPPWTPRLPTFCKDVCMAGIRSRFFLIHLQGRWSHPEICRNCDLVLYQCWQMDWQERHCNPNNMCELTHIATLYVLCIC